MLQARKKEPTAWPAHKCASNLAWMQEPVHITLQEPVHSLSLNLGVQPAKATAEHAGRHLTPPAAPKWYNKVPYLNTGCMASCLASHTKKLDAARQMAPLQVKGLQGGRGPHSCDMQDHASDCLQPRMSTLSPLHSHTLKTVCATIQHGVYLSQAARLLGHHTPCCWHSNCHSNKKKPSRGIPHCYNVQKAPPRSHCAVGNHQRPWAPPLTNCSPA
jgi:hypothetical protein